MRSNFMKGIFPMQKVWLFLLLSSCIAVQEKGSDMKGSYLYIYINNCLSLETLSVVEKERILRKLEKKDFSTVLDETLLSEKELYFRFGIFLTKEEKEAFSKKIVRKMEIEKSQ